MSNNGIVVIRSRFQPFTTFHSKIIDKAFAFGKTVVLCIIRDYETISLFHRISKEFKNFDLRHLPIFNPLTTWDVIFHINRCLENFCHKKNRNSIIITISPLKFPELVNVMTSHKDDRDSIEIKDIFNLIEKVPSCQSQYFNRCQIKKHFGQLLSFITLDCIPERADWVFGVFDKEDHDDACLAETKIGRKPKIIHLPEMPSYSLDDLTPPLGLYGIFCLWIYLKFVDRYNTPGNKWRALWEIKMPEVLENDGWRIEKIGSLQKMLKNFLISEEWDFFENKVEDLRRVLIEKFDGIPEAERNVLLNFYKFIELANSSVKAYNV